jgi:hypothetical protein
MDFEPYMTWRIELVEEHELLQLHFAVIKHAHINWVLELEPQIGGHGKQPGN